MKFSLFRATFLAGTLMIGLGSDKASAAGYEKNIMWGGRTGGVGGASVSFIEGADALYFNPAGLVSSRIGHEVSFNPSLVFSSFSGAIVRDGQSVDSGQGISTPFGLTYGMTLNDNLAFGIGGFVSGGSKVKYGDVNYGSQYTLRPTLETDFTVIEVSIGGAYRVTESLKIGAAWRMGMVNADFASASEVGTNLIAVRLDDMKDERFDGFKIGAQYSPSEEWGIGLAVRTEFSFDLDGKSSGYFNSSLAPTNIITLTGGDVQTRTHFPLQASLGGYWNIVPEAWRTHAEYVFTDYSRVQSLVFSGAGATLSGAPSAIPISTIVQNWKDQHNLRLAAEYIATPWPVRFGYVWTSQVVPDEYARATFSAPGNGHTFTIGTGKGFLEDSLRINIAAEYSIITGDVPTSAPVMAGDYSTTGYELHTGLSYMF